MLAIATPIAAAAKEQSSNFLVSPNVGLMIWTLIAFFVRSTFKIFPLYPLMSICNSLKTLLKRKLLQKFPLKSCVVLPINLDKGVLSTVTNIPACIR